MIENIMGRREIRQSMAPMANQNEKFVPQKKFEALGSEY
jgi:hypothetical protein